ncbi:MAG: hypothetical protein IKE53_00070 [Clostridiales bacterium]|nr:hypothetical protein [Clostridiales bacterium]
MKTFNKIYVKTISVLLILCSVFMFSGCGAIMDSFTTRGVESFVTETFTSYIDSQGTTDLASYSKKDCDVPELTDEQQSIFSDVISRTSFEIGSTKIKEGRKQATCQVSFKKVADLSTLDSWVGTYDDISEAVSSVKKKTVKITFKIIKKNDKWMFDDLSEFFGKVVSGYEDLCFLDDEGNPINITPHYIESFMVDSVWYDPVMDNPLDADMTFHAEQLVNVLYFDHPISYQFTAQLYSGRNMLAEKEVTVDDSVVARLAFDSMLYTNSQLFEPGEYYIKVMVGSNELYETDPVIVR